MWDFKMKLLKVMNGGKKIRTDTKADVCPINAYYFFFNPPE